MGAFHTGVYRNFFAEMGKSEAEIQKKISDAAETFFYGSLQIKSQAEICEL